ncbi:MAG: hypothetical protein CMQ20_03260 [Gammaproteobacteria bacterium]|jgi:UrcA family protein|nr:hypothetical protein [Gammaproteobacteria bacterium]|tara:strand:- start:458 stop:808 length:351 start_codon:yes stop_codon:yes gene_type:complete
MKVNRKTIIAAAAFFAMTTPMMAGAVVKSGNVEEVSITVDYKASDLNTNEGRAMVEGKIRNAAAQACGPTGHGELRSLKRFALYRACFDDAVENALQDLDKFTAAIEETNKGHNAI